MGEFLSVSLVFSLLCFSFAQEVPAGDLIPLGTGVEIELLEGVSSETLQAGQSVPFKLVNALEAHRLILLPANTPINGTITVAHPSGHWHKAGAFDLKLEPLKLANGTAVRMDFHRPTRLNARGEKAGEAIGGSIMMAYYFPLIPVALIAGARKGRPFKIRAGERYLVYVTGVEGPTAGEALPANDSPKP